MRMEPSTKGRRACRAIANGRNQERLAVVSVEPIPFWVDDGVGGFDRAPVGSSPRDLLRAKFSFCGARDGCQPQASVLARSCGRARFVDLDGKRKPFISIERLDGNGAEWVDGS